MSAVGGFWSSRRLHGNPGANLPSKRRGVLSNSKGRVLSDSTVVVGRLVGRSLRLVGFKSRHRVWRRDL